MYDLLVDTVNAEREREARRIAAAGHARRVTGKRQLALITRVRRAIGGCAESEPIAAAARTAAP